MKHIFSILFLSLFASVSMSAQTTQTAVSGSVVDKEGEALAGSTILFLHSDTIAGGTVTNNKGKFELKGLPTGEYECKVSMVGFKPGNQKFTLSGKIKLSQFMLEEDATALDEVTVSAGMRSKELAGMSIYYLSDRAKKESNAYYALQEIPKLIVNPLEHNIALEDGSTPLILVDGVKIPLDAISPEFIESVEVIENLSARYRGDSSVTSVLNLKLKKEGAKPYLRGQLGTMFTPNLNYIYSNASFEIGNSTSSIYFNGGYSQNRKTEFKSFNNIFQGNLHKIENRKNTGGNHHPYIMLGFDKQFSKKDYIAIGLKYFPEPRHSSTLTDGQIEDTGSEEVSPLKSYTYGKTRFNEVVGNLYYKHSFTESRVLELGGDYFYSISNEKTYREEQSEFYNYTDSINLENIRHKGILDVNYSDMLTKSLHLEVGSNTEYSVTDIDDILFSMSNFRYRRTREYLYAGLDNNRASTGKFNYSISLGLDMVFSDAAGEKHSYIDLVPSVSLRYKFDSNNNLSLIYDRTRTMPSAGNLNPLNTSTDTLRVNIGNPYLTPTHKDRVRLTYSFSNGRFRINPYVQFYYQSDIILPYAYLVGDIYVNTYQNFGHTSQLLIGTTMGYSLPQGKPYFGGINIFAWYQKDYIEGMPFNGNSFAASINLYFGYNKVNGYANFGMSPNQFFSLYGKTHNPFSSNINVGWQISDAWRISLSADGFLFPRMRTKSWTVNGDYYSYSTYVATRLKPKLCIGIWYSFATKNFKWRNKKQFDGSDDELKSISTQ